MIPYQNFFWPQVKWNVIISNKHSINKLFHELSDKLRLTTSRQKVFCKKGVLKNSAKFTEKHLCQSLFQQSCKPLPQALSREFCGILKSTLLLQNTHGCLWIKYPWKYKLLLFKDVAQALLKVQHQLVSSTSLDGSFWIFY